MSHADDLCDLRQLVEGYAVAIDARDSDAFLSLFADGGGMDVYAGDRESPVAELSTPEQLRTLCEQTHDVCRKTFHFVGNHVARVDGDTATADTYCYAHHLMDADRDVEDGDQVDEVMVVHYEDRFVRVDGSWRIERRRANRLWSDEHRVVRKPLRVDRALADALRA